MNLKIKFLALCAVILFFAQPSKAQWVVADPGNLAQGIINATKNIAHTSKTASNMVNNFQETVKIYEQGKQYYDALKQVKNVLRDARKVQQTILMVGEISDIYVNSFQRMVGDENYTVDELSAMANGYAILLEEANYILTDLRTVINEGLSMSDRERMEVIDYCYDKMSNCKNLVRYYTNKNVSISFIRAKSKNDSERVISLYGNPSERYW